MTEEEIIRGCIEEKHSHQKALYDRFSPKMYVVCLRYGRNSAEAQDILQDGFIKVFDNISQYGATGSFEGWVRRIMVNTALNYCRKKDFKHEIANVDELYQLTTDAKAISNLSEREILKILQGLPTGYRVVFNLYAIEGFTHKEIAEKLNISDNTSRSQLAKARKLIQKIFKRLNQIGHV